MALDFSKLHDAIGKVADLAKAHAASSAVIADTSALVAAHVAELDGAQKQVDDLVAQLLAAVGTPAEVHGLAAVAAALDVAPAPGVTILGPVAPVVPNGSSPEAQQAAQVAQVAVAPIVDPVAPVAPVTPSVSPVTTMAPSASTFLPGDPRAAR